MRKALTDIPSEKTLQTYTTEKFVGPFTTLDAHRVCRVGEFISDVVVYEFGKVMASLGNVPVYVESPAFISLVLNLEKIEINYTSIAHMMKDRGDNPVPTWGERVLKGTSRTSVNNL